MSSSSTSRLSDRVREASFISTLVVGMTLVSFSGAFLILGLTVNSQPPAPYLSPGDKRLLIIVSGVSIGIGLVIIHIARRFV